MTIRIGCNYTTRFKLILFFFLISSNWIIFVFILINYSFLQSIPNRPRSISLCWYNITGIKSDILNVTPSLFIIYTRCGILYIGFMNNSESNFSFSKICNVISFGYVQLNCISGRICVFPICYTIILINYVTFSQKHSYIWTFLHSISCVIKK